MKNIKTMIHDTLTSSSLTMKHKIVIHLFREYIIKNEEQ